MRPWFPWRPAPFYVYKSTARLGKWVRVTGYGAARTFLYFNSWEEAMGLAPVPDPELIEPCS